MQVCHNMQSYTSASNAGHKNMLSHTINSFLASGNFCRLLITFANSLDLDQDRCFVGPDLDPSCDVL